jgi:hypothetical protein
MNPSSTVDNDVFCAHRLLLPHKPLTRTRTLGRKNHPRKQVLRLTLKSSAHIDYWWVRNCWRKQSPCCPKKHPGNPVLRLTLTSSVHIDYWWLTNCWRKQSPYCPKDHPRNPILRLTLKSSMYINYYCLRNCWQKFGPWDPKIIQEAQFYGWRWHLLRT